MTTKLRTFMLVDDDIDDAEIFEEILRSAAPEVQYRYAPNGKQALDFLYEHPNELPSIIFLDLNMPRMDGKECLKKIKENDRLRHIPVIIYTTSSQSSDIEETMIMGATCFITKPSGTKDLQLILSTIAHASPNGLSHALEGLKGTSSFIVC